MTTRGEYFTDENENDYKTFIVPMANIRPGEDLSRKVTPKSIDDYPIVIYPNGEIQDGHHRYKYMIEKGFETVRVILANDIDQDYEMEFEDWMPTLWDTYWDMIN